MKTTRLIIWLCATITTTSAHAAEITLMSPTVNDGSFESNVVTDTTFGVRQGPFTIASGVWNITNTQNGGWHGGMLTNIPNGANSVVLAGANGENALFSDGTNSTQNSATATSISLFGGQYLAVHAGDVFSWSFTLNSWGFDSSGTLQLNFGGGDIQTVGTGVAGDGNISVFETISGTYTATAADAAGGQLNATFTIETGKTSTGAGGIGSTNVYGDDVQLSVAPVPEPSTIMLLGLAMGGMATVRCRPIRASLISK